MIIMDNKYKFWYAYDLKFEDFDFFDVICFKKKMHKVLQHFSKVVAAQGCSNYKHCIIYFRIHLGIAAQVNSYSLMQLSRAHEQKIVCTCMNIFSSPLESYKTAPYAILYRSQLAIFRRLEERTLVIIFIFKILFFCWQFL